jgi:hypothetical protein
MRQCVLVIKVSSVLIGLSGYKSEHCFGFLIKWEFG